MWLLNTKLCIKQIEGAQYMIQEKIFWENAFNQFSGGLYPNWFLSWLKEMAQSSYHSSFWVQKQG